MEWKPGLVGLAVGIADGWLARTSLGQHRYSRTTFRVGVFLAGLGGEMLWNWPAEYTYGAMTASTALITSRIAPVFATGPSALGDIEQRQGLVAASDTSQLAPQLAPQTVRALPAPASAQVSRNGATPHRRPILG